MKYIIITFFGLAIFLPSVEKQDNVGKAIFENSCKSCHLPDKATEIAPSFQNIRKDYGLQWTLAFIKDSRGLKNKKDIRTLYSYYLFGSHEHLLFSGLESNFVVKILDYVDKFPVDTFQFRHRFVSNSEKQKYVYEQLAKYTVRPKIKSVETAIMTENNDMFDTAQIESKRKGYRKTNPKRKGN